MGSIPPLFGGKMRCCWPSHSLWMANSLMAFSTDADEVTLTFSFCVHVENIQGQLRAAFHVVDMMNKICSTIAPLGFTDLAFIAINPKHICTQ